MIKITMDSTIVTTESVNSGYYMAVIPSGIRPIDVDAIGYDFPPDQTVTVLASNEVFKPLFMISSEPVLAGDTDGDSDVDGLDLAAFASYFAAESGRTNCSIADPCECDLNDDGSVNPADVALFAAEFGG